MEIQEHRLIAGILFPYKIRGCKGKSLAASLLRLHSFAPRALPDVPAVPAGAQLVLLRCEVAVGVERGLGLVGQLDAWVRRVLVGERRSLSWHGSRECG